MPKSKWRWYGGIFIAVAVSLWPISYVIVANSTPHEIATTLVKRSPIVQKELGEVSSVRLSPLGYAAGLGSSDGYADLEFSVRGQRAAGKLEIDLDQKGSSWQVLRAILITSDGRTLDISERKQ
jgi:hypothetical protein